LSISYLAQEIFNFLFGNNPTVMPGIFAGSNNLFFLNMENSIFIVLSVSFIVILSIYFLVQNTKMGQTYRAVSENSDAVELLGINVYKIIIIFFSVCGLLASCAGFLYSISFRIVDPYVGLSIGMRSYIATIVSGMKSIVSAVISSLCIALLEVFLKKYFSNTLADIFIFSIFTMYLLINKKFSQNGDKC
jgi:branched-chain amino acid transport system permease protein